MTGRDIVTINDDILSLVQKLYPDIYKELSTEEQSLFAFLLSLESYLHDACLMYLSNISNEKTILTAETMEGVIANAVTHGYEIRLCRKAGGIVHALLPVIDENGYLVLPKATVRLQKEIHMLKGISRATKELVDYRLRYSYVFNSVGLVGTLQKINDDGSITLVPVEMQDKITSNGKVLKCFRLNLEVEQVDSVIEVNSAIEKYDNLSFPMITIPLLSEDISKISSIDLLIDNREKANYVPVLTVASGDAYYYSLRIGKDSTNVVLSNGVYGKKVLPNSLVNIRIQLCSGGKGNILENSIRIVSGIINDATNQILTFDCENVAFVNGSDFEDLGQIKLGTLAKLITQNRLTTFEDFTLLIESLMPDCRIFATNRFFSYSSNDVSIYLSKLKDEDPTYNITRYMLTSTKTIVIKKSDIVQRKVLLLGDYVIMAPNTVLRSVEDSGYDTIAIVDDVITDINQISTIYRDVDVFQYWFSVFAYYINKRIPIDNSSFLTPLTKLVEPSSTLLSATLYSLSIVSFFTQLRSTINAKFSQEEYRFTIVMMLLNCTQAEFMDFATEATTPNNPDPWWRITVNGVLLSDDDVTATFDSLNNTIQFHCSLKRPIDINVVKNLTVLLKARPVKTSLDFVEIIAATYLDCNILSTQSRVNKPKVSFNQSIKEHISTISGIETDDIELVIYDVPLVSLAEISEKTFKDEFIASIRDTFREIGRIVLDRAPMCTTYSLLFAKTLGYCNDTNFLISGSTSSVQVPLRLKLKVSVLQGSNIQQISENIKYRLLTATNVTSHIFNGLNKFTFYTLLSDIDGVTTIDIEEPKNNIMASVDAITSPLFITINRLMYKLFTPYILHTLPNYISLDITYSK